MTSDYAVVMKDGAGRTVTLYIAGASIDAVIATGASESQARDDAESNAFGNAIAQGLIGADAWAEAWI